MECLRGSFGAWATNSKSDAAYVNSKLKGIELTNMAAVCLFFGFFSSFLSHLRLDQNISPIFFIASILEGLGVALLLSLCLLECLHHQYCRRLLREYPVFSIVLCVSNGGAAIRYVGRVMEGSCSSGGLMVHFCNIMGPVNQLPLIHIFVLMLSPLLMLMLLNDGKIYPMARFCSLLNATCIMYSQTYVGTGSLFQFWWLLIIELIIWKMIYDTERNSVDNFMIQKERKEWADLQIKNSAELAEARTRSIRLEMANVAHDLRNPLQAFGSGIQCIQDTMKGLECPVEAKSEIVSLLQEMDSSVEFMNVKINRFIDVSKLGHDIILKPRRGSFDVNRSVQWAIGVMSSFTKSLTIKVDDSVKHDISSVIISDKIWFEENILCYISNAVKHTPAEGTVLIRCLLSADQFLTVEVEDTGIGIDSEKKNNLFKPFSQAQSSAGGTGLGLYSLASRVKALGGTYGVRGRADGQSGSCFYFSIPYVPDDPMAGDISRPEEIHEAARDVGLNDTSLMAAYARFRYTGTEQRVLVVDDNAQVLKVIIRGLKSLGVEHIDSAINGFEAFGKMKLMQYSCVLMDAQMPIMDGFESTRRIRAHEKETNSYPQFIICCSANDDAETRFLAMNSGMDGYLSKPFKTSKVLDLLSVHSGNQR